MAYLQSICLSCRRTIPYEMVISGIITTIFTLLFMQFQWQTVRILEEGHFLACVSIYTYWLTFNTNFCQFFYRLFNTLHAKSQMAKATCLRTIHTLWRIRFCEDFQFCILIHSQIQFPVVAFRTVVFTDNWKI